MDHPNSEDGVYLRRLRGGKKLAEAPIGEKLAISGIAGYFPNSYNAQHFMENLLNKVDLCDDDERRWAHMCEDIPKISGKVYNVDKFDAGFFGVPELQANWMDPMCRMLLERSVEAVMDAGINPEELVGSNTGIFLGCCHAESEKYSFYSNLRPNTFAIIGCTRSMLAQRLSYSLKLTGPSVCCDTACSSGLYAFELAYRSIREGKCERAIVGGCNMCMDPYVTLQFARLGVLNMNTGCRPFDRDATGYTRSEGIVVMVLQKEKDCRRIYAKIIHSKVNADGFKEQGITYPSGEDQLQLLKDVYEECEVDPTTLAYVEAHGTGTKVGDPEELAAIDKFFCTNRQKPLLIGSVKGNIGHSEPVSGLCSVVKVMFGMNFDVIPPNIHYDNPRPEIPALMEKRLLVVTEKTNWPDFSDLAAINCFGFGGANCHVVLEKCSKRKSIQHDETPRLICLSGRTRKNVEFLQDHLSNNELDYEFVRLIQEVYSKNIVNHIYRGYLILLPQRELKRSTRIYKKEKPTLYLCFGNENVHNCGQLQQLQQLIPFKKCYDRCLKVLTLNNINIQLKEDEPNNILQKVLITIIIHCGLIELFKTIQLNFDYLRGYSMGEFTAGYANGSLTLDEALMASYTISKHFLETEKSDEKVFEKLVVKLQAIFDAAGKNVNRMQTSKANTYKYGSMEYFLFNLLNPGLVVETYPEFEKDAVVLNVDFKCGVKESAGNLEFLKRGSDVQQVLDCIGRLYEYGFNPVIDKLFPKIPWPVSRGTAMLSPLIKWNHENGYYVPRKEQNLVTKINEKTIRFNVVGTDTSFYKGHVIDGRTLFPATGYMVCVWQFFADIVGEPQENIRICFENVKFLRATTFSKDGIMFAVVITKEGYFEVVEGNATVVTGKVYFAEKCDDWPTNEYDDDDDGIVMHQKDIYKELRLRGYHYKGAFKAVEQMNGNRGIINWNSNWIPFLDNMLQLRIIKEDTRALAVPTGIDRLYIDSTSFLEYVDTLDEDKHVPCYLNRKTNTIFTKGIKIIGLRALTIARKRQKNQPVLETYKFTPNNLETSKERSARINMQIVLENKPVVNMKILEIINENSDTLQPLSPEIVRVLEDLPLIQPEITLFSRKEHDIETNGIILEKSKVSYDRTNAVYIASGVLQNEKELQAAVSAIEEDGFILTIENAEAPHVPSGLTILTTHKINRKYVHLLRRQKTRRDAIAIDVSDLDKLDQWLETLKTNYRKQEVILFSQRDDLSGILGLTNCIRREPNGENVSCVFIRDDAPHFEQQDAFFRTQLDKGMAFNVYENGQWGTYRHLLCDANLKVECEHFFGNTALRGDISSCDWFQGKLSPKDDDVCHIYYSALNFRDVMLASGKLPVESISTNRLQQMCVEGFEFSGRDKDGNRIMGISACGANSNLVKTKSKWPVPDQWSLEDAATIPVVYLTVLKAFHEANMTHGKSILIHSGTGGIGQAALNVCEYYKCNIFVTVGTEEKKKYLLKNYPFLKPAQIGNSRNTSFEQMVSRETRGRGVDIVLNSLAEEKLQASVRCLAKGGYFMEIGKYDLSNDTRISADLMRRGCTYQGIMLDASFNDDSLIEFFRDLLKESFIRPLKRTVFEIDQLEDAFRYMMTGKHIGKVVIKLREEEEELVVRPKKITHLAHSRFYCDPTLSYVILGGLGGFGLELADWLMLRGAKYLVLSSRVGISSGYQESRIKNWNNNGVQTLVVKDDISTREGCNSLIKKSNDLAPIGGIFNLAVELRDALLENLTHNDYATSLRPKAIATRHLDQLTREHCPRLEQFVVFSSVSCGRGNAGQSNYGLSNSVMERICERRGSDGLPGLAIQWGAIGDVGLVAEMQKEATEIAIGGTLQQRITSCLDVLDKFLKQREPVVSSIVVAEKFGRKDGDNLVGAVLNMLGLSDLKTISLHASLAELGMDSMMAIEIKQTLERDYDVFLSVQDMRTFTFAKLIEINESRGTGLATVEESKFDISTILTLTYYDEKNLDKTIVECTQGKDLSGQVLLLPGIEGSSMNMTSLMNSLKYGSYCLQYKMRPEDDFEDFLNRYYPVVSDIFKTSTGFNIIAHSFGGVSALEMASKLEKEGRIGKIVLIDSSPDYMLELLKIFDDTFGDQFEIKILLRLIASYLTPNKVIEVGEKLKKSKTTEERKQITIETIPTDSDNINKYLYVTGQSIFSLILAFTTEQFALTNKLKSKVLLCKPTSGGLKDIQEDYHLSKHVENLEIATFEGDHVTILENADMHEKINEFLCL